MKIINGKVFNGKNFDNQIKNILIKGQHIFNINDTQKDQGQEIIDATDRIVCPGFIDIHTHGIDSYDLKNTAISLEEFSLQYAKKGTTSFVPTTMTEDFEETLKTLKRFETLPKGVVGIHLEGPFLHKEKRGAHPEAFLYKPTIEWFEKMDKQFKKIIKRITVAPELDKDFIFADYANQNQWVLSYGHTTADSEFAYKAFKAGYRLATHTFNAMPIMHHRNPSITCSGLVDDSVFCEIIPDFIHVHKDMIKLFFKVKNKEKTIIISDSISVDESIKIIDGVAYNDEDTIAGSIISMQEGVKNLIDIGLDEEAVLRSATYNPAKVMNMEKQIGYIDKGADADVVILDKKHQIQHVIRKGELIL